MSRRSEWVAITGLAFGLIVWSAGPAPATEIELQLGEDVMRPRTVPGTDPVETVSLAFTGDVLIHGGLSRVAAGYGQPYDFRPMFQPIAPVISDADLALCHLEVPLSVDNSDLSSYPRFNAPRQVADALHSAGFDGCSTASNHAYDRGVEGVGETIEVLETAGLGYSGTSARPDGGWEATYYQVGDLIVAHISATYWLNGLQMPDDSPWLVQLLDADEVLGIAARSSHLGADLVVVSMHCCVEFRAQPTDAQQELAHQLIGSPYVDLVVGHHPHVIGPVERVGDEFVLYSLGNFVSGQRQIPSAADGVVAVANATRDGDGWRISSVEAVPTYVERGTFRVLRADRGSDSYVRTMNALAGMGVTVGDFHLRTSLLDAGLLG
jgi:poly-gamma-glutamate synthesis protein (capsule biosynthesis protein)